jgi:hypothetical protein
MAFVPDCEYQDSERKELTMDPLTFWGLILIVMGILGIILGGTLPVILKRKKSKR